MTNSEIVASRRSREYSFARLMDLHGAVGPDGEIVADAALVPEIVAHSWRADKGAATRICRESHGYQIEIGGVWYSLPINP